MSSRKTIGLVAAIPEVELPAIQLAFDLVPGSKPDDRCEGARYWISRIAMDKETEVDIVIACTGRSGNTEVQLPVERLIRRFRPEFMIFVGICCGVHDYSLGDVVTSDLIWAYEYLKTSKIRELDRTRARVTPRYVQNDVSFFDSTSLWRERFLATMHKLPASSQPRSHVEPGLHKSIWIASGEKVMGDGELAELNAKHDLVRVGEMEGYGFATACDDRRPSIPWLVVRGVSDYGDSSKDNMEPDLPLKDEFHLVAAISAATFVRTFLETAYTTATNVDWQEREVETVYESDYDPEFIRDLIAALEQGHNEINFVGLGLKFLRGNNPYIHAMDQALSVNKELRVRLFLADPECEGLLVRIADEEEASNRDGRPYRVTWPRVYRESIKKAFWRGINEASKERVSFYSLPFCPTASLIQVDDTWFFSPFGTPDIRGSESPWLRVAGNGQTTKLHAYLRNCMKYSRAVARSEDNGKDM